MKNTDYYVTSVSNQIVVNEAVYRENTNLDR
jgi:hypothetical protein